MERVVGYIASFFLRRKLNELQASYYILIVLIIATISMLSSSGFAGSRTYTADADFLGFTSWDKQDEDWSDISDWTSYGSGTYTVGENPSGQLRLKAGDASGTDSYAQKLKDSVITDLSEFTIEIRVKFDQLGNSTGNYDGFQVVAYNGTNQFGIFIYLDKIVYRNDTGWVDMASDSISTGTWYTYRLVCDSSPNTFKVYRNGSLIVTKNDARSFTSYNGQINLAVWNYSASPTETEAHIDNYKVASGLQEPLVSQKGNFVDVDIHEVADELRLSYDSEDTPARHPSGTWTINCDAGASVQWDNLSWTATENGSSNVKFRFRSAASEGGLSSATWYPTNNAPSSWDLLDEDWEDYSDWTFTFNGTYSYEENPSGQLHLTCGDASGTDSNVAPYRYITTSVSTLTMEVKVYFDQLANYNEDHHGFIIGHKNGTYKYRVQIFADRIRYRASAGWEDMLTDSVSTGTWYVYRVLLDTPNHSIKVYRDGVYLGEGTDPYADSTLNGHTEASVINWPTSPAETEVHIDYTKAATGLYEPKYVSSSPHNMDCPDNRWLQVEAVLERGAASETPELEDMTINWTGAQGVRRGPGLSFGGFAMY